MPKPLKIETICANGGVANDTAFGSVAPPLYLSANYAWQDPQQKPRYDYARSGNPTREQLEGVLCELEGAQKGVVVSSGMAALSLVLNLVKPGDIVFAPHDCYGGTHRLLTSKAKLGHFKLHFIDQSDPIALKSAFIKKPKLVLIETPSNPLLRITDIETCVQLSRHCGAISVADNTFLSPLFQKPLSLGCDIVLHSTTKFLNGHSDVVGGAVLARDVELGEQLAWWANCTGVTGAPFDSFLTLRGIRTLAPRLERQQSTTNALVQKLTNDSRIAQIYYPGLESHPGHLIANKQQLGFGSMFSVELADSVDIFAFLRGLKLFTTAESLGGFESLVCIPAAMTHASMTPNARAVAGISDRLIRFSIGLEHYNDLLEDILNGLNGMETARLNSPKLDQSAIAIPA